jgi:hypothetical protein
MGIDSNYIIVEAELKDGVADEQDTIVNAPFIQTLESANEKLAIGTTGENLTPDSKLPQIKEKKYAPLSKEARSGVNKYIYYACSSSKCFLKCSWCALETIAGCHPRKTSRSSQNSKVLYRKIGYPSIENLTRLSHIRHLMGTKHNT